MIYPTPEYIHAQLEPDEVIQTGNGKRFFPLEPNTLQAKNRCIDELRQSMGEEEFLRECQAYDEWEKSKKEETEKDNNED